MVSIRVVVRATLLGLLGCTFVIVIVANIHGLSIITPVEHDSETLIKAYYINLLHRTDRRWSIEKELAAANLRYARVDGVYGANTDAMRSCWKGSDNYTCAGMIGVKFSHLRALDLAFPTGDDLVAVFEDDFTWSPQVDPALVLSAILTVESQPFSWDVLLLAALINEKTMIEPTVEVLVGPSTFSRLANVHAAQAAHGYVVRRTYLPKLRSIFESCEVTRDRHTAIDQCWKMLQRSDRWIAFDPLLGVQSASYSDIELKHVDYFNTTGNRKR
jgi:GR25 family glycosyltransferase involved in LPS biosynthesis